MTAEDIREMSFQNVLDNILKPAGVHVGGYPEDIFTDLEEAERDKWNCNICFLVVRDARECANKHLFCNTCVFAWSLTYGENSQKCPMCRVATRTYVPNKEVNKLVGDKRVKCPDDGCTFSSALRIFLMHSHGRERYVNDDLDLESLRPSRPAGTHGLLILPGGVAFTGDLQGALGGAQRAANIREQLQQGRAMIHQMMMLLHLEMQLRQQALVSYSQAQDPNTRLRRLDEVLSLNEQLNEVGTILSALLSTPIASRGGRPVPTPPTGPRRFDVSRDVMLSRGATSMAPSTDVMMSRGESRTTASLNTNNDDDDDDDDEPSSSDSDATSISSVISVAPRVRMSLAGQLHSPRGGPLAASVQPRELQRPQRRNEIRAQLYNVGSASEVSSSVDRMTPRLLRREPTTNLQSRPTASASASAQDAANNNNVSVSIQRLDSNNASSHRDSRTSEGDQASSSLPPIQGTPSSIARQLSMSNNTASTRGQISPRAAAAGAAGGGGQTNRGLQQGSAEASNSQTSPRSLLPAGSSAHQRILQSLSGTDNDEADNDTDTENNTGTAQPNSVSRRPYISVGELLRGPRVTSEGVTASGATFSTSADTPLTRAAHSVRSGTSSGAALEGVTSSGATYSTQVDTPLSRAASGVASRRRSEAADSIIAPSIETGEDPFDTQDALSSTFPGTNPGRDSRPTGRQPLTRYAPQRRFRRNSSVVSQSSNVSSEGAGTAGGPSNVPYVPHRSSSPGRLPPGRRGSRSHSLSVDDRRRLSMARGNDEGESVVRRAARGPGSRASLPTTPGQLLRARRSSQTNPRRLGNNRDGPNGTI